METSYLDSIPLGREGWVYLLHAEGTDRYKIGRSVNPITRCADIQRQSPYPLRIIRSCWTIDAITDEAKLHQKFAEHRVFGEWFDFEDECRHGYNRQLFYVNNYFDFSLTMGEIRGKAAKEAYECVGIDINADGENFKASHILTRSIFDLYEAITSRNELILVERFMKNSFFDLVVDTYKGQTHTEDERLTQGFEDYMCGVLTGFAFTILNKKI